MRKILFIMLCSIPLSLTSAEPKVVAKNFVENFAKGNVAEAKKYADSNSLIVLSFLDIQTDSMAKYIDYNCEIVKDSIVNDSLAYVYYLTPDHQQDKLTLIKENNEWKVSLGQMNDK